MVNPAVAGLRKGKVIMDVMQWLTQGPVGEFCFTILVSMVPIVELRGGIPFGVTLGLPVWAAYLAAVIGNILPVPFILVYIRRIFQWMRRRLPRLNRLVDKLERKAHLKGRRVTKYKYLGLMLFVAIPLPGTGAWTGALAAAFLDMPLRKAIPSIFAGILIAGIVISILTFGVASLF
jgi:uncharacterized membrane protein